MSRCRCGYKLFVIKITTVLILFPSYIYLVNNAWTTVAFYGNMINVSTKSLNNTIAIFISEDIGFVSQNVLTPYYER